MGIRFKISNYFSIHNLLASRRSAYLYLFPSSDVWKKSISGIDEANCFRLNIVRKTLPDLFMPGSPDSGFFFHWQSLFWQFSEPLTSRRFSIRLSVFKPLIWSISLGKRPYTRKNTNRCFHSLNCFPWKKTITRT